MACVCFKPYHPRKEKRIQLNAIQEIIDTCTANNDLDSLSSREIYYKLLAKNLVKSGAENNGEYDKVADLIRDARMGGLIDWDVIVDRNRETSIPYYRNSIEDAIESVADLYKLDRMRNQEVYLEVMIEKMAIYDVVDKITYPYTIPLTGNKGNSSKTVLYDTSKRLVKEQAKGKKCVILYIGDHDPSGLMMIDNIAETLKLMGVNDFNFELRPIALTYEQVLKYKLPPNDVKTKDKNAPNYIKQFGEYSWECDALPAKVLQDILEKEIKATVDMKKYTEILELEQKERERISDIVTILKRAEMI